MLNLLLYITERKWFLNDNFSMPRPELGVFPTMLNRGGCASEIPDLSDLVYLKHVFWKCYFVRTCFVGRVFAAPNLLKGSSNFLISSEKFLLAVFLAAIQKSATIYKNREMPILIYLSLLQVFPSWRDILAIITALFLTENFLESYTDRRGLVQFSEESNEKTVEKMQSI